MNLLLLIGSLLDIYVIGWVGQDHSGKPGSTIHISGNIDT